MEMLDRGFVLLNYWFSWVIIPDNLLVDGFHQSLDGVCLRLDVHTVPDVLRGRLRFGTDAGDLGSTWQIERVYTDFTHHAVKILDS